MGKESIVERIISDAEKERDAIISDAEKKAEEVIAEAELKAQRKLDGTKAEVAQKVKAILDGKSATARLDCAKAELSEKRRVLDAVYESALKKLIALDKKNTVALAERLLTAYADEGDEIVFSSDYKHASEVLKLEVIKAKKLTVSKKSADIEGGFILRGKYADKDLSYGALLNMDREENVSSISAKIFVTD